MQGSLEERSIQCPYCGEAIDVLIDTSEVGSGVSYIEDCQVCCRPIEFSVSETAMGEISIQVGTDHE